MHRALHPWIISPLDLHCVELSAPSNYTHSKCVFKHFFLKEAEDISLADRRAPCSNQVSCGWQHSILQGDLRARPTPSCSPTGLIGLILNGQSSSGFAQEFVSRADSCCGQNTLIPHIQTLHPQVPEGTVTGMNQAVEDWCHPQPNPPSPKGEVHVECEDLLVFCLQLGLLRPRPHAQGPSGSIPPQFMLAVAPSCPHTVGLRRCHVECAALRDGGGSGNRVL